MSDQLTEKETIDGAEASKSFLDMVKNEALEWYRLLIVFVPVLFIFTMFLYEQRVIPSESMVPNLQVGDRVLVNKYAYGFSKYSVPWGVGRLLPLGDGRIFAGQPKRGDVIVFRHPHFNRVMIKRLIGLPGDTIELRDEQVYLNGQPVPTEDLGQVNYFQHKRSSPTIARELQETYGDKSFVTHQIRRGYDVDTTPLFKIPEGHYFFVGDNRDNSVDARKLSGHCRDEDGVISQAGCAPRTIPRDASVGFVPFDHLIGRAETVVWTTKRCKKAPNIDCPPKRVWRGL